MTYEVRFSIPNYYIAVVEADSQEEAESKALAEINADLDGHWDGSGDHELIDIDEY